MLQFTFELIEERLNVHQVRSRLQRGFEFPDNGINAVSLGAVAVPGFLVIRLRRDDPSHLGHDRLHPFRIRCSALCVFASLELGRPLLIHMRGLQSASATVHLALR